jgi:restriction system protein
VLTQRTRDGGRDIVACRQGPVKREQLHIECKRYTTPVPVQCLRSLLGVVSSEKANKGVLVTTSRFTTPAVEFSKENPRIELIDGLTLVALMNEHLGDGWPLRIDRLIIASEREHIQPANAKTAPKA